MSPIQFNGGPAFPRKHSQYMSIDGLQKIEDPSQDGMTLRDYFAGQLLQGVRYNGWDTEEGAEAKTIAQVATVAYQMADAMLKEREK